MFALGHGVLYALKATKIVFDAICHKRSVPLTILPQKYSGEARLVSCREFTLKRHCSLVAGLLFWRCPTTVAGFVIAIVINALYRTTFWPWAHVREKVFEFSPSIANQNAATAIILVRRMVRIAASAQHSAPSGVLASAMTTVLGSRSEFGAPARSGHALAGKRRPCGAFVSAIAAEFPSDDTIPVAAGALYSDQATIPLTRCHWGEFSAISHDRTLAFGFG